MTAAPGKVLWAGEYAILDGAPAVVCAVDRLARARLADDPQELSPFLAAARAEIAAHFGAASAEAEAAARVIVDSRALEQDGRKLGLGSSAAATVAAIAAAAPSAPRDMIHDLAHRAHGAAQAPRGARGSGADVAASVYGGLLRVERIAGSDDSTPLQVTRLPYPADLAHALIWTGQPADTASLVARVRAFRDASPRAHAAAMQRIADASASLADALASSGPENVNENDPEPDPPGTHRVITAIETAAEALSSLAMDSGAPLLPPSFPPVQALARRHRGAAKPTGAGGGDLILTLFPTPDDAAAFHDAANAGGMTVIQTSVDLQGVRL